MCTRMLFFPHLPVFRDPTAFKYFDLFAELHVLPSLIYLMYIKKQAFNLFRLLIIDFSDHLLLPNNANIVTETRMQNSIVHFGGGKSVHCVCSLLKCGSTLPIY